MYSPNHVNIYMWARRPSNRLVPLSLSWTNQSVNQSINHKRWIRYSRCSPLLNHLRASYAMAQSAFAFGLLLKRVTHNICTHYRRREHLHTRAQRQHRTVSAEACWRSSLLLCLYGYSSVGIDDEVPLLPLLHHYPQPHTRYVATSS